VTSKPDFKVMILLLVFMQLTRDLFAIAKFLFYFTIMHHISTSCNLTFDLVMFKDCFGYRALFVVRARRSIVRQFLVVFERVTLRLAQHD